MESIVHMFDSLNHLKRIILYVEMLLDEHGCHLKRSTDTAVRIFFRSTLSMVTRFKTNMVNIRTSTDYCCIASGVSQQ